MTTTTDHTQAIRTNIERLATERGLTLEELAEQSHEPLSAFNGPRLYLRSIERAARTLNVTVNEAFGFGTCEPWCNNHQDDGDTDYCCRVVGEYEPGASIEIWHDALGTRIDFDEPRVGTYTPEQARALATALTEALLVLDAS